MKGGGIVLLAIFIFLFTCFVWGVASVVGNARDAIKAKRSNPKADRAPEPAPTLTPSRMPNTPMYSEAAPQANPQTTGVADTLEHLQKIHELHSSGALTDAEFAQLKAKLIQNLHPA